MGWKSVAWAGCLVPVLAGCGGLRHAVTADPDRSGTRLKIARDQRRDAREAWQAVRTGHAGRGFSDEFRDGFHDGYVDYLDRGETALPPAVPPNRYAREPATAPDGGSLMRDYYLGFDYGKSVAVASGRRATIGGDGGHTAPAPVVPYVPAPTGDTKAASSPPPTPTPPRALPGATKFDAPNGAKTADADPVPKLLGLPGGAAPSIPPLPKPEVPIIKPFSPPPLADPGQKFGPLIPPPDADRLPAPNPPLPLPVPSPPPTLPIPELTPPTPAGPLSILDKLPVVPFRFDPAVMPAGATVPAPRK